MSGYPIKRIQSTEQIFPEDPGYRFYHLSLNWKQRLRIANYLNSVAYNYPEDSPPRMDKTKFKARSSKDEM
jgi:hypothetical protein